jgi:phosphatidylinositol phospholipase C, delta
LHACVTIFFFFCFYQNGSDSDEGDAGSYGCHRRLFQECSPDYKSIITIQNKKLKGSLKDKLKTDGELRRLSWSETTLEKASESHGTDIIRYVNVIQQHALIKF